jgi:hypothetical protein
MGTIKFVKLNRKNTILLVILSFILIYHGFFYSPNYKHYLYEYFEGGIPGKMIRYSGILSKANYEKKFSEQVIQDAPRIILVSSKSIEGWNSVIFIDNKGKDHILVCSSNVDSSYQPDDQDDFAQMVIRFLNLTAFNKYINELGVYEKRQIVDAFCSVYKWYFHDKNFIIIDTLEVFESLYFEKYEKEKVDENVLLDKDKIIGLDFANQISSTIDNSVYVWTRIIGIIHIEFIFDENHQVDKIKAKFIGLFGNELYY